MPEHNNYCIKAEEIGRIKQQQENFDDRLDEIANDIKEILGKLNNGINTAVENVSELAKQNAIEISEIKDKNIDDNKNRRKMPISTKIAILALVIPNIGILITILMVVFRPFAALFGIEITLK